MLQSLFATASLFLTLITTALSSLKIVIPSPPLCSAITLSCWFSSDASVCPTAIGCCWYWCACVCVCVRMSVRRHSSFHLSLTYRQDQWSDLFFHFNKIHVKHSPNKMFSCLQNGDTEVNKTTNYNDWRFRKNIVSIDRSELVVENQVNLIISQWSLVNLETATMVVNFRTLLFLEGYLSDCLVIQLLFCQIDWLNGLRCRLNPTHAKTYTWMIINAVQEEARHVHKVFDPQF